MSQPITLLGEPLDVLVAFLGHLKETRTGEGKVDPCTKHRKASLCRFFEPGCDKKPSCYGRMPTG